MRLDHFIDNASVPAASGRTFATVDPATEEPIFVWTSVWGSSVAPAPSTRTNAAGALAGKLAAAPAGAGARAPTEAMTAATAEPAKTQDGAARDEAKAATLLGLGQNLEKSGKAAAALGYYQRVVKEHPGTASARTAAGRIKALGGK